MHTRKGQAWKTIKSLQKIWKSNLPRQVKVNVFQTLVKSVLLYGSETWTLTKQLERSLDGCYTRLLRAALKHQLEGQGNSWRSAWRPPKSHRKERRLSAAGHFHRHQKEAAGTLVLWDPRHGSSGSHHKIYVQVLLEDAGLENTTELISLMEDRNLWKSTDVYRHDDDGQLRSKWWWFTLKIQIFSKYLT